MKCCMMLQFILQYLSAVFFTVRLAGIENPNAHSSNTANGRYCDRNSSPKSIPAHTTNSTNVVGSFAKRVPERVLQISPAGILIQRHRREHIHPRHSPHDQNQVQHNPSGRRERPIERIQDHEIDHQRNKYKQHTTPYNRGFLKFS